MLFPCKESWCCGKAKVQVGSTWFPKRPLTHLVVEKVVHELKKNRRKYQHMFGPHILLLAWNAMPRLRPYA